MLTQSTSLPPPPIPSLIQIVKEGLPTLTSITPTTSVNSYLQELPENLHSRVNKDIDLQDFINQLTIVFPTI